MVQSCGRITEGFKKGRAVQRRYEKNTLTHGPSRRLGRSCATEWDKGSGKTGGERTVLGNHELDEAAVSLLGEIQALAADFTQYVLDVGVILVQVIKQGV